MYIWGAILTGGDHVGFPIGSPPFLAILKDTGEHMQKINIKDIIQMAILVGSLLFAYMTTQEIRISVLESRANEAYKRFELDIREIKKDIKKLIVMVSAK